MLLIQAAEDLHIRAAHNFEGAGIVDVTDAIVEVLQSASFSKKRSLSFITLKIVVGIGLVAFVALLLLLAMRLDVDWRIRTASDLFQTLEAAIQVLIMFVVSAWTLIHIDKRIVRETHLKALAGIREMAHIIDMHQLDKDPGGSPEDLPADSDENKAALFEYLDCCRDMLSLLGEAKALYAAKTSDDVTLEAINGIQELLCQLVQNATAKMAVVYR